MTKPTRSWADAWLASVASHPNSMRQKKLSVVEAEKGGLALLRRTARARGVHLLLLSDDRGTPLVAASLHPFKVLC